MNALVAIEHSAPVVFAEALELGHAVGSPHRCASSARSLL